jgi:steroid delta-isomerase-like uncharacterized protein
MKRLPLGLTLVSASLWGTAAAAQDLGVRIQEANEHLLNQGHVAMAPQFFSSAFVLHLTGEDLRGGPEIIQRFVTDLRAAFPDLKVEVEVLAVQGNRVAWLRTHRGTHRAAYMGVAPSGRTVEWRAMVVTRFEEGKIAEEWSVTDLAGRLHAP